MFLSDKNNTDNAIRLFGPKLCNNTQFNSTLNTF